MFSLLLSLCLYLSPAYITHTSRYWAMCAVTSDVSYSDGSSVMTAKSYRINSCRWAIVYWDNAGQASSFLGFVDSVPQDKFVVVDMDTDGSGEWQKWNNASFFGAPFIWTSLHNMGGNDGIKVCCVSGGPCRLYSVSSLRASLHVSLSHRSFRSCPGALCASSAPFH